LRETGAGASPVTGDLPWTRVRKYLGADQTILSGTAARISWNDSINDYGTVFDPLSIGIRVKEDGLYGLMLRLNMKTLTDNASAHIFFDNLDSDGFANTGFASVFHTFTPFPAVSLRARLAATEFVEAFLYNGSAFSMVIDGNRGSYWEMVKLGDATTTGRDFP
jgi:hypothetical protein